LLHRVLTAWDPLHGLLLNAITGGFIDDCRQIIIFLKN
jgi:hypothetical protein